MAFALAVMGVLLAAYTFVRLTQRFHHAGSVYGFVGAALGPRAGVISGWALAGTYTFYGVVTAMAGGRFATGLLTAVLGYTLFRNVWPLPTGVAWWGPSVTIAWFVAGIAGVLARPAATRRAGQLLTRAEGLTVPGPAPSGPLARDGQVTP